MRKTETETMLERRCGSCRWLSSHIYNYDGIFAEDILSGEGRFPILKCGNPYSPKHRKYVSRSNSCDRYFPKES